jgi:asparagine synthase (glutamine-hydrolysing)
MCGIVGVATNSSQSTPLIEYSLAQMAKRGPDGEGAWVSPSQKVRLGHRRLSIVDLSSAGQQPMHNEDKSVWAVCNGEIYNYPKLRSRLESLDHRFYSNCDSEVILHAYEQWGSECVNKLEGMFAFVLWDEGRNELFAARDRVGIKPLCYAEIPGGIVIASDVAALLPLLKIKPDINPEAVAYAMSLRYIPSPLTIWHGVKKLEPGHYIEWNESYGVKLNCYWTPPSEIDYHGDYSDEAWQELFEKVLKEHLLSDVPIGLFLSGGLDSSTIAIGVKNIGYTPKAITVSFPQYYNNEVAIAQKTSKELNLDHQTLEIKISDIDNLLRKIYTVYDEPHCNYGLIPMYVISEASANHFKTVLSGDGGDECFGGYPWQNDKLRYFPTILANVLNPIRKNLCFNNILKRNMRLRRLPFSSFTPMQAYSWKLSTTYLPEEIEYLMSACALDFSYEKRAMPFEKHFSKSMPRKRALQRVDLMTFCSESINPKIDRASMGHSLEVRVPFLDRRIIEWALRRPVDKFEKHENASKPVLRRFLKLNHMGDLLKEKKQGFGLKIANKYNIDYALEQISNSWWVKSGFWRNDWRKIIDSRVPGRHFRVWSALMMAKWADKYI